MKSVGGNETKRNVLLDASDLIYRSHFSFCKDVSIDNYFSELVRGMFTLFSSYLNDINSPTRICVFFDGVPSRRLEIYSEYKQNRKDVKKPKVNTGNKISFQDKIFESEISAIKYLFKLLGCDVFYHPNEESDDLIASFIKANENQVNIILSTDKDFFQLVRGRTIIYRPSSKNDRFFDEDKIRKHTEGLYGVNVPPSHIKMFKAILGDPSDNIPGVKRLSKKSVSNVCSFNTIDEVFSNGLKFFSEKEKISLANMRSQLETNLKLVSFYDEIDLDSIKDCGSLDKELVEKIFQELSISVNLNPFFNVGKTVKRWTQLDLMDQWLIDI